MRREFFIGVFIAIFVIVVGYFYLPLLYLPIHHIVTGVLVTFIGVGFFDAFQTRHTIRRNFPILGRIRYLLESIRPEINQYFVESNSDGVPFSREQRSVVYQRAKNVLDTLPFGTQMNVYQPGYEWVNHSVIATEVDYKDLRVVIGEGNCKQPYDCSLLNISAMSYGALSKNAILALNGGAKDGDFAHNTGEGSISPYHLQPGGDLIWQIGTGYFGCRTEDGQFSEEEFVRRATLASVKMIELKLSQGAKPGHGGILPGEKVNEEIAAIRGVPLGKDVLSPPSHRAFHTPIEMMNFMARLRELSGGKPVGFKFCLGKRREFFAICKAMIETGNYPDFIVVDGGEGGTGAAPIEFSNHIGAPGVDSLIFVHNALTGFGLRQKIKVISSGKIITGFGIVRRLALGADLVYSARGMMMALGCIQALRCNNNACPTGVATQNPSLVAGLVVENKRKRVFQFHRETLKSAAHIMAAMGVSRATELHPWHIMRRISPTVTKHYGEVFEFISEGSLLADNPPESFARAVKAATAQSFRHIDDL